MREHYCSFACEEEQTPCDLCLAQRRKIQEDRSDGKPTLSAKLGDLLPGLKGFVER